MATIGITRFEFLKMLPGLRKRLKRSLSCGNLDVVEGLITVGWLCGNFSRAADDQYEIMFRTIEQSFYKTAEILAKEEKMAKIELGITVGEIMSMLPEVIAEGWKSYSDDKKITVDEALLLVATILREMAEAADDPKVGDFFVAQAEAMEALAPFFVEEEPV